jgi:GntR family transcriptional regulator
MPKYHRVKAWVTDRIADGTWPPGSMLPPEPELCRTCSVSRITVRKAIGDLVYEGKVRTVQGKGTFVSRPKVGWRFVQSAFGVHEDLERRGLRLTTDVLRQEVVPAGTRAAEHLSLQSGEPVLLLVRRRSVEGERVLVSTTYLPAALCPGLAEEDLSNRSLFKVLRERFGLKIGRGDRTLEAEAADQWAAKMLDLPLASPLLRLDSTGYLPDGRPFEYSETLQRGDRARVDIVQYTKHSDIL